LSLGQFDHRENNLSARAANTAGSSIQVSRLNRLPHNISCTFMEYMYIVFVYMYIMLWLQVIQIPVMTENTVHAPRVLFL